MLITDPNEPDNPIVFVNGAFSKLTGFDHDEILGRNCRFLQGPLTDRGEVDLLRASIAAKTPIELELLNYRKDGTTFWNRLLVSPVFNDDGDLTYFFASQFDVTFERERLARLESDRNDLQSAVARREAELIESEERLRFALKAGRMGSWSLDLQTLQMITSEGCKETYGRPLSEPFTYDEARAAVHPDDRARRDGAMEEAIADGSLLDVEYRLRTPAGEERWVQIRGQASYRADGTPLALIGVLQEITERKRAEEHRTLLANELSHRVKNSLAMVQAIVGQTLRKATSLEEAGATLEARIHAMAAANDLLVNERWESASMRKLLQRTLAPFGINDGTHFELDGPDLKLSPSVAVALALGLHEMATNAAKYGALSQEGGVVRLSWEVVNVLRPHRLQFTWIEIGGPPVTAPTRTGFGTKLIERVIASEIGGKAEIDYQPNGVIFKVAAPLPESDDEFA
jgi:PAS domain S-box-containing protein